ncbi:hypothetical protein FCM35_KLT13997 [Carex littledalei]|uniref:Uncharacterized protein n=1 Tax=Carex littledalei TaxID=544730 RepID=A0A833QG12_9POAL|nr:hypothetical protein FCM35_KLT13997 [Carex littledalei]
MASSTKSDDTYITAEDDEELFELDLALMDEVCVQSGYRDDDSKKEALLANCLMPVSCISNAKPINDFAKINVSASIGLSYMPTTASSRRFRRFRHERPGKVISP